MDRFNAMSVLVAVVEEGSLSAGARRLRLPLTTVSRKVADLENHLRTRLLTRTSRRVDLTEAGQAYVAAAQRILDQVQEAERAATGEYTVPRGELAVTAPVAFGRRHVLPIVVDFLAAYPEIVIRLLLIDRSLSLVEDHVDVALRIGPLADSALVATRVGAVRRIVCAAPAYLARRGQPGAPEELTAHDLVSFEGFPAGTNWRFRQGVTSTVIPVRPRLAVNAAEAAVDAARSGVGITRVLSYQAADEIEAGTLRVLLEAYEPEPLPVSLIHPERALLPLKVRAFLDWTVPRIRARLASQ